jgi:hypothetical protein
MDPSQQQIMQELSAINPENRTDRTVTLAGDDLRLRYSPEPGVDVRIEASDPEEPDAVVANTVYEASAERPAAYPPELPYLPGLKAGVTAVPGRAFPVVTWFMLPDVDAAAAEIVAQSTAAGWTESPEDDEPVTPGLRMLALTRPGQRRSVIVTSFGDNSTIVLSDEPAGE